MDPLWTPCGPLVDPLWTPCGPLVLPLYTFCAPLVGPRWTPCGPLVDAVEKCPLTIESRRNRVYPKPKRPIPTHTYSVPFHF